MQLTRWLACLLCAASMAAGAEAPVRAKVDAEALIERCWAASQEDLDTDSTLRIGRGVSTAIDCLEREIIRMVEARLECVPGCGTAYNNVGAFELAERLEDVLREVATGLNDDFAGTGWTAQEFIAAGRAKANKETTVFVHLDQDLTSVDSMVNSVIGALVMPCNPMWDEGCEIPMEPLAQMLRDAEAQLPAGGLPCDRATLDTLEACLPGFEVSPSPNVEQLYLTTRRT